MISGVEASKAAFLSALQRAREDECNSFASVSVEEVRCPESSGIFAGTPFAAKDNLDTAELPTTANTPGLMGTRRGADNPVVAKLKASGAMLIGKTNTHELALGITTDSALFPATRNPWSPVRSAGGSSGDPPRQSLLALCHLLWGLTPEVLYQSQRHGAASLGSGPPPELGRAEGWCRCPTLVTRLELLATLSKPSKLCTLLCGCLPGP
ncbi:hypothetical protein G7067_01410 [Leucobacter insecticola]|uniref:Amidase domain-containing protein n=1 Tax=Leucobacter insecticola TaxID=2714934 RepID=A0A6G8FFZ8_9MICO|nr:hypothetical protein G7067_01410 [Leucobacter insecticola]